MEPSNRQSPSFDDAPPDRLSERGYRLRARLGSGRLGAIYEAQDELSRISGSKHFVAVQLIDDKIATRPGFAAEFERGASELKSIAHPNIVRLLEYGSDNNRYYLVNELLESASLRFVLNDAGVLPMPETIAVLGAVGDALQYLHAKSMVHGNLRPENVLVTFGYEVKLLDIVPGGWLLGPNDALGVPARSPDKRDDVFGVACLAYEMLSGRHPFNGNTAQEAYRAGLEAAPIEGLTSQQWQALANALAVHRDDRTPSVAQLLDEFGVARVQKLKTVVAAAERAAAADLHCGGSAARAGAACRRRTRGAGGARAPQQRRSAAPAPRRDRRGHCGVVLPGAGSAVRDRPDVGSGRADESRIGRRRSRTRVRTGAGTARDGPGRHRGRARDGARARREAAGCARVRLAACGALSPTTDVPTPKVEEKSTEAAQPATAAPAAAPPTMRCANCQQRRLPWHRPPHPVRRASISRSRR